MHSRKQIWKAKVVRFSMSVQERIRYFPWDGLPEVGGPFLSEHFPKTAWNWRNFYPWSPIMDPPLLCLCMYVCPYVMPTDKGMPSLKTRQTPAKSSVILTNGHFRDMRPLPHQTAAFCITNKHSENTLLRVLVFELMMTSNLNEIRDLANPSQKHIIGNIGINANFVFPYICDSSKCEIRCQWIHNDDISKSQTPLVQFLMAQLKLSWQYWHFCIIESLWKSLISSNN